MGWEDRMKQPTNKIVTPTHETIPWIDGMGWDDGMKHGE